MNNYQIYDEIGKGEHSVVYKGRHKKTVNYYAIASIKKKQRQLVLNSVQNFRYMNHPNIIRFHHWYETNNHLWVITEYCTGGNFRSVLRMESALSPQSVFFFCKDIIEGLLYIHTQGTVYVDLKPSNLLLDATVTLRFYDFSLSTAFDAVKPGGFCVKNPQYMAPELFHSTGVPSVASDLWSVGCIMYEMVTGKPPFCGEEDALISSIEHDPHSPVAGMNSALAQLIDGLLQKDPLKRYNWRVVLNHPYWNGLLAPLEPQIGTIPPQPAWERYVKQREETEEDVKDQADEYEAAVSPTSNKQKMMPTHGPPAIAVEAHSLHRLPAVQADRPVEASSAPDNEVPQLSSAMKGADQEAIRLEHIARNAASRPSSSSASASPHESMRLMRNEKPTMGLPSQPSTKLLPGKLDTDFSSRRRLSNGASENSISLKLTPPGFGQRRRVVLLHFLNTPVNLEELMVHPTDAHIRPLVLNHRIERPKEVQFNREQLGLPARTLKELKVMPDKELEIFLTDVYRALSHSTSIPDKVNIVSYCETICADATLANVIINSSIMSLFSKVMLQRQLDVEYRTKAASAMGVLVRHATFIHADLAKSGILTSTIQFFIDEPNSPLRRKLLAFLGELLFYVATQRQSERANWQIAVETVKCMYLVALKNPDEIIQHYAAKSVENIVSISDKWLAKVLFTTPDVVEGLLTIYKAHFNSRNDNLRSSALAAAMKLAMTHEPLVSLIMAKRSLWLGSVQGATRFGSQELQIIMTFLNFITLKSLVAIQSPFLTTLKVAEKSKSLTTTTELTPQVAHQLMAEILMDMDLLAAVSLSSLESNSSAVRIKAAVNLALLAEWNTGTFERLLSPKVLSLIDMLLCDTDTTVQRAMGIMVPALNRFLQTNITKMCKAPGSVPMSTLTAIQMLLSSPFLSQTVRVTPVLLRDFGDATLLVESKAELSRFQEPLTLIVKGLLQNDVIMGQHSQSLVTMILPTFSRLLAAPTAEKRFTGMQMCWCLLSPILTSTNPQDAAVLEEVQAFAVHTFVPNVIQLIADGNPLRTMTLHLLKLCLMASLDTVMPLLVSTDGILEAVIGCLDTPHVDRAALASMELLLELIRHMKADGHTLNRIVELDAISKLVQLMWQVPHQTAGQEPAWEPCLNLAYTILRAASTDLSSVIAVRGRQLARGNTITGIFLPACTQNSGATREVAGVSALCIYLLAQLYEEARNDLFTVAAARLLLEVFKETDDKSVNSVIFPLLLTLRDCISSSNSVNQPLSIDASLQPQLAQLHQIAADSKMKDALELLLQRHR